MFSEVLSIPLFGGGVGVCMLVVCVAVVAVLVVETWVFLSVISAVSSVFGSTGSVCR